MALAASQPAPAKPTAAERMLRDSKSRARQGGRHAEVLRTSHPDGTASWRVREVLAPSPRGHFRHEAERNAAVVAQGSFHDDIASVGWSWLFVESNSGSATDLEQAYGAGMLEAYLTAERIGQVAINAGALNWTAECPEVVRNFLTTNAQWMEQQIATPPQGEEEYWYQVSLVWEQLKGLVAGYQAHHQHGRDPDLGFWELWSLSGGDDMYELMDALTGANVDREHDHCSAIVKVTPNNEDLLITHTSWEGVGNMLRTFKRYNFPWARSKGGDTVPSTDIVFASYPGVLFSGDDWYQTSQQLVIQETTIHTFNMQSLYNEYIRPTTVMDWIRNMVANRMARGGKEWSDWFGMYNSGTYNNAFLLLDYKLWTAGQAVKDDTFWYCEQLPGNIAAADLSPILRNNTYFASYNVAYFPIIANLSGTDAMCAQYGDYYCFNRTARARIFARDHTTVTDVDSLKALIRYNDFKHDPLSACPCNPPYTSLFSLSTRQDLDDPNGTYEWDFEGFRNHVGIDAKVTSASLMSDDLACWAQSGPTHDTQPVFQWSTSLLVNVSHVGMPDVYDFDWEYVSL